VTANGRELTPRQHSSINDAISSDFEQNRARRLSPEELASLGLNFSIFRNNIEVFEIPSLASFDDILVGHPGRGGDGRSHGSDSE